MGVANEDTNEKFVFDPEFPKVAVPAAYIDRILEHTNDNEVIFTDKNGTIKSAKSVDKEVSDMSNDSFHTLFQELKTDMREREDRTRREISEREERFEKQLERVSSDGEKREDRILSSIQSIESNIQATLKEREDRINDKLSDTESRIASSLEKVEARTTESMSQIETRINDSLSTFETRIHEHVKSMETMKTQNFWGNIAMFVGMLAIVVTLIIVAVK
ncbi:hypothetical protein [Lysinibacillus sp. NPDC093216]|uniref:hypothetical protein n=1 Tax=Lysinibacillus sp. NPDC093216 TaxID=3390576 RepID=UPI003CFC3B5B